MKEKKRKSNAQLIIGALLSGKTLDSGEISDMISKKDGREIKIRDVSSMLSRISNSKNCDLGYFIEKKPKEGFGFVYRIIEEALDLSQTKAYQLTLKTGKGRYTLDQALEEFPNLGKYTKTKSRPGAKAKPEKRTTKKAAKPAKTAKSAKTPKPKKTPSPPKVKPPASMKASSMEKEVETLTAAVIQRLRDMNLNVRVSVQLEED